MTNKETKKKWYKTIGFWVTLIVAIISGIIIPLVISKSSDFQITIGPNVGEIVKGGTLQTKIIVESQKYKNNIRLTTKSQSDKIDIIIDPANGIAAPKFESNVTIKVASDILEGNYELEIVAIGAKNKVEHSSIFFLTVKNPLFSPQPLGNLFYPDGFMGDTDDISLDTNSNVEPHTGNACTQIKYIPNGTQKWAGIYWLYPNFNWGDQPTGRNLTGAKSLSFMARGSKGGEVAEFKVGGVSGKYTDSLFPARSLGVIKLTPDWREYSIDISDCNLSNLFGGFCWVTNKVQNPNGCIIYLDDIIFR